MAVQLDEQDGAGFARQAGVGEIIDADNRVVVQKFEGTGHDMGGDDTDELILDGNILDFYIADKQVYALTSSGLTVDRIVKIDRQTQERKMIWTE